MLTLLTLSAGTEIEIENVTVIGTTIEDVIDP